MRTANYEKAGCLKNVIYFSLLAKYLIYLIIQVN
jgi:hypothetical protein